MTTYDQAVDAWITAVRCHNPTMSEARARAFVLDRIENGHDTEVRDLVTLQFKPHHITYTFKDNDHFCPGYYDCLRCAG